VKNGLSFLKLLIVLRVWIVVDYLPSMNQTPHKIDDALESDAVWKLLEQAPCAVAGPRFVDDTVRVARLAGQESPWWRAILNPMPLAGLAGATVAAVFGIFLIFALNPTGDSDGELAFSEQAAEIEEIADTETLISAADHLDEFSDTELVAMIGL
jgi:hypothetical protein